MPARTTTKDGDASDNSMWDGGTALGASDTITASHSVNFDTSRQIGSSPSTGGTPAFQWASGITGKTVTIAAGVTLTAKGSIDLGTSAYNGTNDFAMGAGANLVIKPASGQQYYFGHNTFALARLTITGTSVAHCSISTDKSLGGLASYMLASGSGRRLYGQVTYCDFSDFGDSSNWGVFFRHAGDRETSATFSVTHCTFTRCSQKLEIAAAGYVGNFIYQNNKEISPVSTTESLSASAYFMFPDSAGGGSRLIDLNGFDTSGSVRINAFKGGLTVSNNALLGSFFCDSGSSWSAGQFTNNTLYAESLNLFGPVGSNYLLSRTATNPHPIIMLGSAASAVTDSVFENLNASNDGQGDCIITGATTAALAITGNLVLPTHGTSVAAGCLFTMLSSGGTSVSLTANHNTIYNGGQPCAAYGEGNNSDAGSLASFRSNLCWRETATGNAVLLWNSGHSNSGGTSNVVTPSSANYNADWNCNRGDAGSAYANDGNGYNGNYTATPGANDKTVTGSPFVDRTRNFRTWGATQGTDGSVAAAEALIIANPALIAQADSGLLAWVRAGFNVTDSTLKDAGHDGVTIGAAEYVAPASTGRLRMDNRLFRPRVF